MNALSQSTLYRNLAPKQKGTCVNRNLANYLNHLEKYNTDHEYKINVDTEKQEIIREFNIILTNGNYLWNPNGEIDNCLQCVTDSTLQLFFPHKYKLQREFVDNETKINETFKESEIDPLSVYAECKENGCENKYITYT